MNSDNSNPLYKQICENHLFDLLNILCQKFAVQPSPKKALYHYTSLEALVNGILEAHREEGKEVVLRATSLAYMNDPNEVITGAKVASHVLQNVIDNNTIPEDSIKESQRKLYTTCFSLQRDSLPMWSTYGNNGKGLVLLFDAKSIWKAYGTYLFKCFYDNGKDICRVLKQWVDKLEIGNLAQESPYEKTLLNGLNPSQVITFLLLFIAKNHSYKYEDEVRAVLFDDSPVKYRVSGNLIIPYKEICLPKESLHEIIVGPCNDPSRTKESITGYLNSIGMNHVYVSNSLVPYRLK